MIQILIIEDEIPARKKLTRFISELDTPTHILAEISTVQAAIEFLKTNQPDLILSDIELLDGNAFEIYKQVNINCPIIFTTAYNQFWMQAFEENGIDYLLKPFTQARFQKAWEKFLWHSKTTTQPANHWQQLTNIIQQNLNVNSYKKRFTIHKSGSMIFLETVNICLFEANEGVIFAHDIKGHKHLLSESTISEIEKQLNPTDFFRINRAQLIAKNHIEKVDRYSKNALAIKLTGHNNHLKTSQSQTAPFRDWLEL